MPIVLKVATKGMPRELQGMPLELQGESLELLKARR